MNLIDSQHLEGELNDILAGDAHPGFHLFATTNPPQYAARKPLSPALKGRFRHLPIREYRQDELVSIAAKVLPDTAEGRRCAEQLTDYHCRLRHYLQRKNISVQPTSLDLQNLAREASKLKLSAFSQKDLQALFETGYGLYLQAAQQTIDTLPPLPPCQVAKLSLDQPLCQWLNKSLNKLEQPWLVKRGEVNGINPKTHEIILQADLDESAARHQIIKLIAEVKWQSSGMPLQAPDCEDTLTQSFYIFWQRHWLQHNFANVDVTADDIFPLTEAQSLTLALAANQPYLTAVEKFLNTADHTKSLVQAGNWTQVRCILNTPANNFVTEPETIKPSEEEPPLDTKASLPAAIERELDHDTAYSTRKTLPEFFQHKVFNCNHKPRMYRLRVFDIAATSTGELIETRQGTGEYGLEVVLPGIIPSQATPTLAKKQTYGITMNIFYPTKWLYLPSLNSGEAIRAMKLRPEKNFSLMRDRYTGLHMLHVPVTAPEGDLIEVHYIVEKPDTDESDYRRGRQDQKPFTTLEPVRPDATCSSEIRQAIDTLFSQECLQTLPEDQQEALNNIKQAPNQELLIRYITSYCLHFRGDSKPDNVNLLGFLLKERQGACRHRTPVFVVLCRYYGIPARIVKNEAHVYPEYSLDGGATWQFEDLGGAPGRIFEQKKDFPIERSGITLTTGSQNTHQTLRNMSRQEMEAMAEALGVPLDDVARSIQSGLALPAGKAFLTRAEVITKLWDQGTEAGLSLGCNLLKDQENLNFSEELLLGNWFTHNRELSTAVIKALRKSASPTVIIKVLKELHYKTVVNGNIWSSSWQYTIREILKGVEYHFGIDSNKMLVIAHVALDNNWLSPKDALGTSSMELLNILSKLHAVDSLRSLAQKLLQDWHDYWHAQSVDIYTENKFSYKEHEKDKLFDMVTDSHSGHSPTFESELKSDALLSAWSDEPEGIPDIERLLTSHPAFPVSGSGKTKHRPALMIECPEWENTDLDKYAHALFIRCAQNSPDLKEPLANYLYLESLEVQKMIQVLKDDKFAYTFGKGGADNGNFNCPVAAALTKIEDQLFVSDCNNHRIQVFSIEGQFLRIFGNFTNISYTLKRPYGICCPPDGHVLIVSRDSNCVLIFDKDGQFVSAIEGTYQGRRRFSDPIGVVMRNNGQIVVAAHGSQNLTVF